MAKNEEQPNGLQQLKQDIKERNTRRLYFFYGEETFLLHYYLGQLRKILIDELTESFNFHKFTEENFNIRSFADAVENLPMMAENTMVWVDDVNFLEFPQDDREKLMDIFQDIPEYCTVVFTFETCAWRPDKRQRKFYDVLHTSGVPVEFAKQSLRDLISWVGRHFASNGKRISNDLCAYLIEITGGTMTALKGEIEKICAYSGADEIVKSDIDAVTEPVLDAVVFQMTDLMSQREYGAALHKLSVLLKMQQKPIAILGAVGSHFRKLALARVLLDNGKSSDELRKLTNMQDYPARKTMGVAAKFPARFYAKAAELILQTDYALKTSLDDEERLLEMLILQLSQEARNA